MRRTVTRLWVPLVALLAMLGSGVWLATQEDGFGGGFGPWGGMGGTPMGAGSMGAGSMGAGSMGAGSMGAGSMGGTPGVGWLAGNGDPVDDLAEARDRAEEFAETLAPGLRVGEVMRFANGYYAELEEPGGNLATEVLVDPRTGAVRLEFGPAMMWNTRYGMMPASDAPSRLSAEQAQEVAQQWADERDGLTVAEPDAFPGYYTLHTLRGGRIEGMLSVNATTGAVWYHSWHGEFEEMSEDA